VQIRDHRDGVSYRISALKDGVAKEEFVGLILQRAAAELEQFIIKTLRFFACIFTKAELKIVRVLSTEYPSDISTLGYHQIAHIWKFLIGASDVSREIEFGVERQNVWFAQHIQGIVAAFDSGGK